MKPLNLIVVAILAGSFSSSGIAVAQSVPATDVVNNRTSAPIKGQYIVVFKDTVRDPRAEVASLNRGGIMRVKHVYTNALKGFAAEIPDVVVNALKNNPRISYVEQDQTVSVNVEQNPATWGIDRIDQATGTSGTYNYTYTGSGVFVFIVDTGIRSSHVEFINRVQKGFTSIGSSTEDCNGHGTHVAGTVGGTIYGVAKGVTLVPVRVLGCNGSGSYSGVIAGVDYVAKDVRRPAVANMSLGGGISAAMNNAVAAAVKAGVTFVVAAGNSNADACNSSPSSTPTAITVGATSKPSSTVADTRASFSNWGNCVDIFAPGVGITSAWKSSNTSTNTISGTSMASPHVAGAAALLLGRYTTWEPSAVDAQLKTDAVKDIVADEKTSPDRLLQATK